jgi:hypothetical protein
MSDHLRHPIGSDEAEMLTAIEELGGRADLLSLDDFLPASFTTGEQMDDAIKVLIERGRIHVVGAEEGHEFEWELGPTPLTDLIAVEDGDSVKMLSLLARIAQADNVRVSIARLHPDGRAEGIAAQMDGPIECRDEEGAVRLSLLNEVEESQSVFRIDPDQVREFDGRENDEIALTRFSTDDHQFILISGEAS